MEFENCKYLIDYAQALRTRTFFLPNTYFFFNFVFRFGLLCVFSDMFIRYLMISVLCPDFDFFRGDRRKSGHSTENI